MHKIGKGEVWALVAAAAYSMDSLFTATAVKGVGINYLFGASLRTIPLLLFTCFYLLLAKKKEETSIFSDIKLVLALVAYGALTFFLGNSMFFSALQKGGVLITTPLTGTQVLWAAGFAILLLGEKLNWKMVAGMLVSISGISLLAVGKTGLSTLATDWWLAIPLALATAICWSLSGVLIAYVQRKGVNRFHALLFAILVGNLCIHSFLLLSGQSAIYLTTPISAIANVIIAGLFGMLALIGLTTALGLTSVASASTIASLQVGLAPLLAWPILHEQLNMFMASGIMLILLGVIIVQLYRFSPLIEKKQIGS